MLPDLPQLILFMTVAAVLIATPGPAVLYIIARSVDQGRRAGIVSVLGISVGEMLQLVVASLGLAELLARSAMAFQTVKLAGAVYLVYLGVQRLLEKDAPADVAEHKRQPLKSIFQEGLIVSFLNPKSALFFAAFLPQFVDVSRGAVGVQILLLGSIFVGIALVSDSLYALAAGSLGGFVRSRSGWMRAQRYATAGTYIGLGVVTAVSGSGKK